MSDQTLPPDVADDDDNCFEERLRLLETFVRTLQSDVFVLQQVQDAHTNTLALASATAMATSSALVSLTKRVADLENEIAEHDLALDNLESDVRMMVEAANEAGAAPKPGETVQ